MSFVQKESEFDELDIDWEIGDVADSAGDGYCYDHFLDGTDENGNAYTAIGSVVSGELVDVNFIELSK